MPGETKADISGWTVDTLHTHIQSVLSERDRYWLALLEQHDKRYEQRFAAQQQAIHKSDEASEKRFANTNEWRQTVNDRDKHFVPLATYTARHDDLIRRIDALEKIKDEARGHTEASVEAKGAVREARANRQWLIGLTIGATIAFLALSVGFIGLFLSK